jgi:hypothetical protein
LRDSRAVKLGKALVALAFSATGASGVAWFTVASRPYNSEGRWFDEADQVVYLQQDADFWMAMTLALALFATALELGRRFAARRAG